MTVNSLNYMSLYTLATNNANGNDHRFNVQKMNEAETDTNAQRKSSELFKGFIDPGYNRSIGIPDNIYLNEKIVNDVETFLQESNSGLDLEEVIRKSWDLFQKWTGKDILEDQDGFINLEQYKKGIAGVLYLEDGKVKIDDTESVGNMEYEYSGKVNYYLNASANVAKDGVDMLDSIFKDNGYSDGVTYPGSERENEVAVGAIFNVFLKDMTVEFDPQMFGPGQLQEVLAAHGADWLRNIQENAQSFLDLLSSDELMELTNQFKLDVTA